MGTEINLEYLEEEALEVNRLFMNWQMLRVQHRKRVMEALKDTPLDDGESHKRIAEIIIMTSRKEEGD